MEIYDIIVYILYFMGIFVSVFYFITYFENRNKLRSKLADKFPLISVLIPAYNEEDVISQTIQSVLNQDYPKDKLEIIVVDDGSTDKTYEVAKSFSNIKAYKKENNGKASALNYGISKAKGQLISVLDADTFLTPDFLKKTVKYFEDEDVGIIVSTLKPYKPRKLIERIQVIEYVISSFIRKILSLNNSLSAAPAGSIFKAELFKKHGGFDEHNLTEDFEIALKAQSHNYKLVHAVDAVAYTDVPSTFKSLARQRIRWSYGALYNIKKYRKLMSTSYGDFGMFFFPLIIVSIISSIAVLGIMVFRILESLLGKIGLLSATNFNISYVLSQASIIPNVTNLKIILGVFTFIIALTFLFLARKYTSETKSAEKLNNTNISFISYLVYVFIYSFVLITFWIISLGYFLVGKTPKW